jgi:hypothetical protein
MQNTIHAQQQKAIANAQHYDESINFYSLFEAGSFDEEVQHSGGWLGLCRDEMGMLQVYAQYTRDAVDTGEESGTGWAL